ncbi:MAG: response regulator [Leptospiraceae bacterium]
MSQNASILILEDSRMSALLLVKTLQQEGIVFQHRIVDNEPDLDAALEEMEFDLVLSDYYMPDLDCAQALKRIREAHPDVPFIIVSGKIGEEMVVEMMRTGATDFVMKDRMDRLFPVVQRELKNFDILQERQRTQDRLKKTEEKYRTYISTILEVIPDGLVVLNEDRVPFLINQAFNDIATKYAEELGYDVAEFRNHLIEKSVEEIGRATDSGVMEIHIARRDLREFR